jgi:coniferyl-aldehyde dehydrogenase
MNAMTSLSAEDSKRRMSDLLARQKARQLKEGIPSAEVRLDRIDRCLAILVDHGEDLVEAMNADFGARSRDASRLADIAGSVGPLKFAKANLRRWMRTEKRSPEFPFGLLGARAEVRFEPKGVVGVISPWNFPVNLTFAPLAGVLAAGNRALVKPSELTAATSACLQGLFAKYFDEEELAVITGGPEVGAAFSHLAFDHLIFTGGTSIAYHVMRAAADNLVPLTLELGGKSPVILGASADIAKAGARVMSGKTLNAGQICLAPDYVLAPEGKREAFVASAQGAVTQMFPTIKDNPDYTAIISQRHYDRLQALLEDARAKGGDIVELNPGAESFAQQEHRKIPPTLILNPTEDMRVMQEEIFGPILPVKTYSRIDDAIGYVNSKPRPLGLYYFGADKAEEQRVLNGAISGGATVNDVIYHVAQEDLPFGGVGPSGMGVYHGREGFVEFSHRRSVYRQIAADGIMAMTRPPYSDKFRKLIAGRISK